MNESLSPTTNDFLDGLAKLGGAIVGLSLFAYVAGYVKALAMYGAIGAGWVVEFLSAHDILRLGSYSLIMLVVVLLGGAYIFYTQGWVRLKILSFWLAGVSLSYFMFHPVEMGRRDWFGSYEWADVIVAVCFVTSGCLLSYSGFLYMVLGFSRRMFFSVLIGGLITLYIIPTYLGRAWAHGVLTEQISMPKASGDKGGCYLLGNVNSKYLIGCLSGGKVVMLKMVEVDKDISFGGI